MIKFIVLLTFLSLSMAASGQTSDNIKDSNTYSTEVIRYKIPGEQHEAFIKAYGDAGTYLEASKYCLGYELIEGEEEPDNFIVIIYWTSKDKHLNEFRKSAEFGGFFNLVKPFY